MGIEEFRGATRYQVTHVHDIVNITCDICQGDCFPKQYYDAEYALLYAHFGYNSSRDCDHIEWVLCEHCFNKVESFIKGIKK